MSSESARLCVYVCWLTEFCLSRYRLLSWSCLWLWLLSKMPIIPGTKKQNCEHLAILFSRAPFILADDLCKCYVAALGVFFFWLCTQRPWRKKKTEIMCIYLVSYHKDVIVHIPHPPIHTHKHAALWCLFLGECTPPLRGFCKSEWQLLEGCDSVVMNV